MSNGTFLVLWSVCSQVSSFTFVSRWWLQHQKLKAKKTSDEGGKISSHAFMLSSKSSVIEESHLL